MEIVAIPNGQFIQNCYLLADTDCREAVVVDPGEEWERILRELDQREWKTTVKNRHKAPVDVELHDRLPVAAADDIENLKTFVRSRLIGFEPSAAEEPLTHISGKLLKAREGGHSTARIVHAGGAATGVEVERALVEAVEATTWRLICEALGEVEAVAVEFVFL